MLYKKIGSGLLAAAMAFLLTACSYSDLHRLLREIVSSAPASSSQPAPVTGDPESAPGSSPSLPGNGEPASGDAGAQAPLPTGEPVQSQETNLRFFWSKNSEQIWQEGYLAGETYWEYLYLHGQDGADGLFMPDALEALNEDICRRQSVYAGELREHAAQAAQPEHRYEERCIQRVSVQRADQQVLSILHRQEWGSSVSVQTLNLDPVTGEKLTLGDVFRQPQQVPDLLEERLTEVYRAAGRPLDERIPGLLERSAAQGDLKWIVGYQNVTFILPPAMDPDLSGLLFFSFWFDESPSLFQERFLSVPSRYVLRLDPGVPVKIDLDSRSQGRDRLVALTETDQYGNIRLDIAVNDRTYSLLPDEEMEDVQEVDLYLVCQEGGDHLLYMDVSGPNQYHALTVYRLADMQLLQRFWNLGFCEESAGGERIRELFVTPSRFTLQTNIELLGTMWGVCDYRVDPSSGLPVQTMPYFDILPYNTLTARVPVEALALPEQTEAYIPAGTELTPLRTDCLHYVDVSAGDGREWRVQVDISRWPAAVNGMPVEECFDGLLYAG